MEYLKNHCWCNSSHWDNKNYDCQIIVSLKSYKEEYKEDWSNLIIKEEYFDREEANNFISTLKEEHKTSKKGYTKKYYDDLHNIVGKKKIAALKPEVMQWLEDNVPDFKNEKGWCIGSKEYRANDSASSFSIFFQRRRDALAFIKRWSKWKKPIHYCQYFTDVRKKLNLETLKYEPIT